MTMSVGNATHKGRRIALDDDGGNVDDKAACERSAAQKRNDNN